MKISRGFVEEKFPFPKRIFFIDIIIPYLPQKYTAGLSTCVCMRGNTVIEFSGS